MPCPRASPTLFACPQDPFPAFLKRGPLPKGTAGTGGVAVVGAKPAAIYKPEDLRVGGCALSPPTLHFAKFLLVGASSTCTRDCQLPHLHGLLTLPTFTPLPQLRLGARPRLLPLCLR